MHVSVQCQATYLFQWNKISSYLNSVFVQLLNNTDISSSGLLNNYLTENVEVDGDIVNTVDVGSQEDDDLPRELEAESMLHSCISSMLNTLAANFPQYVCLKF